MQPNWLEPSIPTQEALMGVNVCAVSTQPRFIADRRGGTGPWHRFTHLKLKRN